MLRIAICDDQQIFRDDTIAAVNRIDPTHRVEYFTSAEEFLKSEAAFDVLLLDIEMPDMDGMTLARRLKEENRAISIIFLTAHKDYMPDAFKVNAFRYLCKPVRADELAEALDAVAAERQCGLVNLWREGRLRLVPTAELTCIEAFGDGTYIYTVDDVFVSRKTLSAWIAELPEQQFFRVHKSYAVSFEHISAYSPAEGVTVAGCSTVVPVARRQQAEFKRRLMLYILKSGSKL